MNSKKLAQLTQYIEAADLSLQQAREVLVEIGGDKASTKINKSIAKSIGKTIKDKSGKIVEGVFNGQSMIDKDEKEYSVPANYASKSKLVEGDILKLTINEDGSYLYKQIKPIERKRVKGELVMDEVSGQYSVLGSDGKKYNVLSASVTYFKGENGDKVTVLVPKDKVAQWCSIENINEENDSEKEAIISEKKPELLKEKSIEGDEEFVKSEKNNLPELDKKEKSKEEVKKEPFKLKIKNLDEEIKEMPKEEKNIATDEKQKIENIINESDGNLGELDSQKI
jgi:hypothetical protein